MNFFGKMIVLIAAFGIPMVAVAADPSIEAAETSVRLGLTGGYGTYGRPNWALTSDNAGLVGVTAGFSDLSPSSVPGFLLPDLYGNFSYDFSDEVTTGPQLRDGTPFAAHYDAFYNDATVRLGAGTPVAGRMEVIPYVMAGYQNWSRNSAGPGGYGEFYQSETLGGGVRFDLAGSPRVVVSASAEGFAIIGGAGAGPSQDFDAGLGADTEERVSLDADYRLNRTWHAFAGLGVDHFGYGGARSNAPGFGAPSGAALQISSMFGLAYGF